ncbi:MAG: DMT family transporter [Rectinemataceae bacterium]
MATPSRSDLRGMLAMAGTAFCWSLGGLFIKLIDWHPFAIAGARSTVAALFILAVLRKPKITWSRDQLVAAFANALTMLLFVYANKHTSSANAILLQYGAPVYVALLSGIFLKERPLPEQILALFAVMGGMLLCFADSFSLGHLDGDIAAVLAGFTFAINLLFMRRQKEGSPLESFLMGHVITAICAGAISLFMPPVRLSLLSLGAVLALGVLQIGLAAVLFSYAIKRVTAIQSSLIAIIEPALNPVWVFLVLREAPTARAIAGGLIIVLAVSISSVITVSRRQASVQTGTS